MSALVAEQCLYQSVCVNDSMRHHIRFSACAGAPYLDVVVDASGQDLITGVIERHSQHLVGVLKSVDRPFLPNVPQLHKRSTRIFVRLTTKKTF